MTELTKERLTEIAEAVEKMTPGEWAIDERAKPLIRSGKVQDFAVAVLGSYYNDRIVDARAIAILRNNASALIAMARRGMETDNFVRDLATNYDHDDDAHKYRTGCFVCTAERLNAAHKGTEE